MHECFCDVWYHGLKNYGNTCLRVIFYQIRPSRKQKRENGLLYTKQSLLRRLKLLMCFSYLLSSACHYNAQNKLKDTTA